MCKTTCKVTKLCHLSVAIIKVGLCHVSAMTACTPSPIVHCKTTFVCNQQLSQQPFLEAGLSSQAPSSILSCWAGDGGRVLFTCLWALPSFLKSNCAALGWAGGDGAKEPLAPCYWQREVGEGHFVSGFSNPPSR